jgi:hypothetical protein
MSFQNFTRKIIKYFKRMLRKSKILTLIFTFIAQVITYQINNQINNNNYFVIGTGAFAFSDSPGLKKIEPVLILGDKVISNLDAFSECIIYLALGYESDCLMSEKKTITYSIVLAVRKKFEETIGISDEIARKIINGQWENLVREDEIKKAEILIRFGFTLNEIQDQMRRIKVLEEKLKKSFFTDIVSLKEVIKKEYTETILDSKAKKNKNDYELKDTKEKTANELIKTLITENMKIIKKE